MGLSAIAAMAVRWLLRAFGVYRKHKADINLAVSLIKKTGFATKQLERFMQFQARVEKRWGARTNAWGKIERAAKAKKAVVLDAADTKYLAEMKRIFDRTIKKPIQKLTS